ncbi:RDD family protein [Thalassomonas sp. M1454]|uniref:RDD family protein n=1 Tax=Thalassomonas sp. M1454 TaxID=2594477 RepID=UPI00117CB5E2|nr:RDD family protein [Thalassomonas sp. M1454]TRX53868.1 RDD family protein [Thalassomonas sp. M1454]
MSTIEPNFPRAGFRRRLGSYIYDALIALAVFMIVGYIGIGIMIYLDHLGLISIVRNSFEIDWQKTPTFYNALFHTWNIFWVSYFFIYFWSKKGQTIGMRAWRLKVQNLDGSLISAKTAVIRLLFTLLGLGNLLVIVDRKNKLALQDRISNSEVVVFSLEANKANLE